nr:BatD family protein [Methylobacterium nodulans]
MPGWKAAALALLLTSPALALEPGDLTLTVTPETGGNATPYPREMVLLHIRGTYRAQITLEDLRQPPLQNFSWTQLGRDRWFKTSVDGQEARGFERVVAVFPQHAGQFTIDPFVHRLTIVDGGGRRVVDVPSAPVPLAVKAWTGPGGPEVKEPWWLPASAVTVTDVWNPEPETLKVGESARRTVIIEAKGMTGDGLPPRPIMRTRGVLTFAGPTERQTVITPTGPVSRATYQWDVRPGVSEPVTLSEIRVPWFDTVSRTMREAEIPARIVGSRAKADPDEADRPPPRSPWLAPLASLAAFGLGLILFAGFRTTSDPRIGLLRALRRAARRGDGLSVRALLSGADPALADHWRRDPATAPHLAALDRALFGPGETPMPDLSALVRALAASRPPFRRPSAPDPLASLDGLR